MKSKRNLRRGSARVLILSLLQEGTLYPALHRLEKEGLLRSRWQVVEEGPSRKYYHLTDKGRKELDRLQRDWATYAQRLLALLGAPSGEPGVS